MNLNINSETSKLKEVLIGNSYNFKSPLNFRDLYDPTSLLNYLKGIYPNKFRLQNQLSKLKKVLIKYGIKVHELDIVDTNQIFARDLAFVIDDNQMSNEMLEDDFSLSSFNKGCFISKEDMADSNKWWDSVKDEIKGMKLNDDIKDELEKSPAGVKYGPR